jgi:glutathione-dependent peroxiredoxin
MLFDREGQRVPQVTFQMFVRMFGEVCWYDISTADLFDRKTVVVFAVSGAFTPYARTQLLGYNEYAEVLRSNGVEEILCISVNDQFLLENWAETTGVDRVRCIPDGNGDFTRALGMMVNLADEGMGERSWRYSMLVKDGVIEKMFIEPDGFETIPLVANAETMLNYINPAAKQPDRTMLPA